MTPRSSALSADPAEDGAVAAAVDRPRVRDGPDTSPTGGLGPRELRHEVGNALTAAQGYAQFLLRRVPVWADESDHRAIRSIAECIARTCRLFDCSSSAASPRPTPCDLDALVATVADQVPAERWADVHVNRLDETPLVGCWDRERLTQVLANLFGNAAKYSPVGTRIEVEIGHLGASGWARLVVRDHGIGIDHEALEAIFSGHRTARAREAAPGQGIGLQLSRRLVEAEGGLLWAMNMPDGGSGFYLELPLGQPRIESPLPQLLPNETQVAPSEPPTVLVVEDDMWTRSVLADLLERAGYVVAQASNGSAGLRLAAKLEPAVVLLDLSLPERSGVDLLHELKCHDATRGIPVIVVSACTASLGAVEVEQARGIVQKPFDGDELLAHIERVVTGVRPGGSQRSRQTSLT